MGTGPSVEGELNHWFRELVKSVPDGEFSNGSKGSVSAISGLVRSGCHPLMIPTEGENGM